MGPGNPPAVWVWTRKTVQFGSKPVQKPDPLLLGGPSPDPYPLTRGFCLVWLDPSFPISASAFRVFLLLSYSDILLLIVKDRCLYISVIFELVGTLWNANNMRYAPYLILKMSVNDICYCVLGNMRGARLLIEPKAVLTAFIGTNESNTPPAPSRQ